MILDTLKSQLISAQKSRDELRVSVLRYLFAAVKNREIELRSQKVELTDEHILKVIQKQIKQREDSITNYKAGNRQDLVDKETAEMNILKEYLAI